MHNATIFKEQIQLTFKETYNKSLFVEGLKHKKELTLAEAIYILSDESLLNEGLFGKMGGLVDKGVETVANKIVGAKDAIANWAITKLGGQVTKKPEPTPFDGAKTILPIAKMAKDDQPGFFAKVAKMTGNTATGIKELYMKLEASYEKIPLIGKIASKVPKGWRTVILALIVIIVAGVVVYREKTGQPQGAPAPKGAVGAGNSDVSNSKDMIGDKPVAPAPTAPAPTAPPTSTSVIDKTMAAADLTDVQQAAMSQGTSILKHALGDTGLSGSKALNIMKLLAAQAQQPGGSEKMWDSFERLAAKLHLSPEASNKLSDTLSKFIK